MEFEAYALEFQEEKMVVSVVMVAVARVEAKVVARDAAEMEAVARAAVEWEVVEKVVAE